MENTFRTLFLYGLSSIILYACSSDDVVNPNFLTPPEPYFLVEEVITNDDGVNYTSSMHSFEYDDQGKLIGDDIIYDDQGRLIQSQWPGRAFFLAYYHYTNDKADSIVTDLQPAYTLYYAMNFQGEGISEIRIYRKSAEDQSEIKLENTYGITYPSDQEILVTGGQHVYHYQLDAGRNPYPYEYRLSNWWGTVSRDMWMILTDRNVLKSTVTINGEISEELEYSYQYNEFGYPTKQTLGDQIRSYSYSESIN